MKTFMERTNQQLIKKLHTLLRLAGIDADSKAQIYASYGVNSSLELSAHDLIDICNKLDMMTRPEIAELDKCRKRVMAAVGGYLREMGIRESPALIKSIACRAAKTSNFNRIPKERLNSIYNAFKNRSADLKSVDEMTRILLDGGN